MQVERAIQPHYAMEREDGGPSTGSHHRDQGERDPASSDPSITHRTSALESLIKIRPQLLHL